MSEPSLNPYAPTASVDERLATDVSEGRGVETGDQPIRNTVSRARTTAKWLLVCGLSAIPSLLFGAVVTDGQYQGMLLGILVFVALYTWLDLRSATYSWRSNLRIRRTLRIGYGTRIAISVLFPLGASLDVVLGAGSVELYRMLSGETIDTPSFGFLDTFLTTLIQGSLLNLVLMVYMLVVHALQIMLVAILHRREWRS